MSNPSGSGEDPFNKSGMGQEDPLESTDAVVVVLDQMATQGLASLSDAVKDTIVTATDTVFIDLDNLTTLDVHQSLPTDAIIPPEPTWEVIQGTPIATSDPDTSIPTAIDTATVVHLLTRLPTEPSILTKSFIDQTTSTAAAYAGPSPVEEKTVIIFVVLSSCMGIAVIVGAAICFIKKKRAEKAESQLPIARAASDSTMYSHGEFRLSPLPSAAVPSLYPSIGSIRTALIVTVLPPAHVERQKVSAPASVSLEHQSLSGRPPAHLAQPPAHMERPPSGQWLHGSVGVVREEMGLSGPLSTEDFTSTVERMSRAYAARRDERWGDEMWRGDMWTAWFSENGPGASRRHLHDDPENLYGGNLRPGSPAPDFMLARNRNPCPPTVFTGPPIFRHHSFSGAARRVFGASRRMQETSSTDSDSNTLTGTTVADGPQRSRMTHTSDVALAVGQTGLQNTAGSSQDQTPATVQLGPNVVYAPPMAVDEGLDVFVEPRLITAPQPIQLTGITIGNGDNSSILTLDIDDDGSAIPYHGIDGSREPVAFVEHIAPDLDNSVPVATGNQTQQGDSGSRAGQQG